MAEVSVMRERIRSRIVACVECRTSHPVFEGGFPPSNAANGRSTMPPTVFRGRIWSRRVFLGGGKRLGHTDSSGSPLIVANPGRGSTVNRGRKLLVDAAATSTVERGRNPGAASRN